MSLAQKTLICFSFRIDMKKVLKLIHFGLCQFDFIEGAFFFLAYTKADMKALS